MTGILARLAARGTGRGDAGGPPILTPPVRPLFAPPEPGSVDLQDEGTPWQTGEAEFADTPPERPLGAPIAARPGPTDTSLGAPEALSPTGIGSQFEAPTGRTTDPDVGAAAKPSPLAEPATPVGTTDRTGRHASAGPERPAPFRARGAEPGTPDRTSRSGQAKSGARSAVPGVPPAASGAEVGPQGAADKQRAEEALRGRDPFAERPPEARTPDLSAQPASHAPEPHPLASVSPPAPEQRRVAPQQGPDLPAPFAQVPASADVPERPALSIGRLDVIFEAPPVPPPPRRKGAERTRGFDGFERARLGLRR